MSLLDYAGDDKIYAVFPLPEMVAFPGHCLRFHVFEPRYRCMVHECLSRELPLGVSLGAPLSILRLNGLRVQGSRAKKQRVETDYLNANHESYRPARIFGAGHVKLLQRLDDGRLLIQVTIVERVRMREYVQEAPFYKASCEVLSESIGDWACARALIQDFRAVLRSLLGDALYLLDDDVTSHLLGDELATLVYGSLKFFSLPPQEGQRLLEAPTLDERASMLLKHLRELCHASGEESSQRETGNRQKGSRQTLASDGKVIPLYQAAQRLRPRRRPPA